MKTSIMCGFYAAVISLSIAAPAAAAAPPAVVPGTFHGCPNAGNTKQANVRIANQQKNRWEAPETFNTSATLDALLAPGADLDRWNPKDGATIEGVVVDVVPGGIESVNCKTKVIAYRDTHIFIGRTADAPKTACVIAEVTPRWRAAMKAAGADWSTATLKKTLKGKRVRFTGWIFVDEEHKQNAVNTNPKGTALWRATVVEVHPITAIEVP